MVPITAAPAPLATPASTANLPAEARKRRRTLMRQSKEVPCELETKWRATFVPKPPDLVFSSTTASASAPPSTSHFNLSLAGEVSPNLAVSGSVKLKGQKAPQKRYDPDVPMTKEEAAEWRREQRRKRNRESAAASRQKTRDRIAHLENIVMEMQKNYEAVVDRLRKYEPDAFREDPMTCTSSVVSDLDGCKESCVSLSPPNSPKKIEEIPLNPSKVPIEESIHRPKDMGGQNHRLNKDSFRPAASYHYPNRIAGGVDIATPPMTEEGVEGLIALATATFRQA